MNRQKMLPPNKPRVDYTVAYKAFRKSWEAAYGDVQIPVGFVGAVRNYYDASFDHGGSGRGYYDDAAFVFGPQGMFVPFNYNTDPSRFKKGIATLIPGWYKYKPGNHGISRPGGGYPAFRPATRGERLPVYRDGEAGRSKREGVAINIHSGGEANVNSDGCQTVPNAQWDAFHATVHHMLKLTDQKQFWYGLIVGPII